MSIVRILVNEPSPPTENEIKKFKELAARELMELNDSDEEIFLDDDCPELTDEQLAGLMPVHTRQNEYRLTAR